MEDKTQIIWIGSNKKTRKHKLHYDLNLCLDDRFTLLGIECSTNLKDVLQLNHKEKNPPN